MPSKTATPPAKPRKRTAKRPGVPAVAVPPPAPELPAGYVDKEHPGSRIRRVRIQTIDAVEKVRQSEERPAGASARPWTETLDRVVHAGLVALGHPPLFPDPPAPEATAAAG